MANNDKTTVVIGDESALYLHLHTNGPERYGGGSAFGNPLDSCASNYRNGVPFNASNPLYGGAPFTLLVPKRTQRRTTKLVTCHSCSQDMPSGSFLKIRDGLYVSSPEMTLVRLASKMSVSQIAEIGMNLCAGYYLSAEGDIEERQQFLTDPRKIERYLKSAKGMRGVDKTKRALNRIIANSWSPMETKLKLVFCNPLWDGGFNMPFTVMNYDFVTKRHLKLTAQSSFAIDLANPVLKHGLEYDGKDSHPDPSKDKQRRNALKSLGWDITAIDWNVLRDPVETERTAYQIAKTLGIRIRKPKNWEDRYVRLRKDLELPV